MEIPQNSVEIPGKVRILTRKSADIDPEECGHWPEKVQTLVRQTLHHDGPEPQSDKPGFT